MLCSTHAASLESTGETNHRRLASGTPYWPLHGAKEGSSASLLVHLPSCSAKEVVTFERLLRAKDWLPAKFKRACSYDQQCDKTSAKLDQRAHTFEVKGIIRAQHARFQNTSPPPCLRSSGRLLFSCDSSIAQGHRTPSTPARTELQQHTKQQPRMHSSKPVGSEKRGPTLRSQGKTEAMPEILTQLRLGAC